jgi:hypothetical protein
MQLHHTSSLSVVLIHRREQISTVGDDVSDEDMVDMVFDKLLKHRGDNAWPTLAKTIGLAYCTMKGALEVLLTILLYGEGPTRADTLRTVIEAEDGELSETQGTAIGSIEGKKNETVLLMWVAMKKIFSTDGAQKSQ